MEDKKDKVEEKKTRTTRRVVEKEDTPDASLILLV